MTPTEQVSRIGDRIRVLRQFRCMDQNDVIRKSRTTDHKIGHSVMSRYETGAMTPSIAAIEWLAECLNLPMAKFFEDSMPEEDDPFICEIAGLVRHITPLQRNQIIGVLKDITPTL